MASSAIQPFSNLLIEGSQNWSPASRAAQAQALANMSHQFIADKEAIQVGKDRHLKAVSDREKVAKQLSMKFELLSKIERDKQHLRDNLKYAGPLPFTSEDMTSEELTRAEKDIITLTNKVSDKAGIGPRKDTLLAGLEPPTANPLEALGHLQPGQKPGQMPVGDPSPLVHPGGIYREKLGPQTTEMFRTMANDVMTPEELAMLKSKIATEMTKAPPNATKPDQYHDADKLWSSRLQPVPIFNNKGEVIGYDSQQQIVLGDVLALHHSLPPDHPPRPGFLPPNPLFGSDGMAKYLSPAPKVEGAPTAQPSVTGEAGKVDVPYQPMPLTSGAKSQPPPLPPFIRSNGEPFAPGAGPNLSPVDPATGGPLDGSQVYSTTGAYLNPASAVNNADDMAKTHEANLKEAERLKRVGLGETGAKKKERLDAIIKLNTTYKGALPVGTMNKLNSFARIMQKPGWVDPNAKQSGGKGNEDSMVKAVQGGPYGLPKTNFADLPKRVQDALKYKVGPLKDKVDKGPGKRSGADIANGIYAGNKDYIKAVNDLKAYTDQFPGLSKALGVKAQPAQGQGQGVTPEEMNLLLKAVQQ